jgi:co-chaperonin GroES (HSP10)
MREQFEQINKLTQELYDNAERRFLPAFPWVMVYVLEKEQKTKSGLIIQALEQNKPVTEGIVLATWKPFIKHLQKHLLEVTEDHAGVLVPTTVDMQSSLKPGDHVLFPHWSGLPVLGFDDKRFRIVKEIDWSKGDEGGIFATVEYDHEDATSRKLAAMIDDRWMGVMNFGTDNVVKELLEQFLVVDRDKQSVTLSGR